MPRLVDKTGAANDGGDAVDGREKKEGVTDDGDGDDDDEGVGGGPEDEEKDGDDEDGGKEEQEEEEEDEEDDEPKTIKDWVEENEEDYTRHESFFTLCRSLCLC